MKKILFGLLLATLLSIVMLGNVKQLEASGTIYIRPDGSVDPPTAPIQRNGTLYTFYNTITSSIVVQKSHVVIDGAGHILEGATIGSGITLLEAENVTIRNVTIKTFATGITLDMASFCTISENNITMCYDKGIFLKQSNSNDIFSDNITLNGYGVFSRSMDGLSSENHVINNTIRENRYTGVNIGGSNFVVSGNSIAENGYGVEFGADSHNCSALGNNITANHYGGFNCWGDDHNISENTIKANSEGGVFVTGNGHKISGNVVTANQMNITGGPPGAIHLWYDISNCIISGNTITANGECGIYAESTSHNNSFSNNIIAVNGYDGIWVCGTNNSVSENMIRENGRNGVELIFSTFAIVSGNTIASNGYVLPSYSSGMRLVSSAYNLIVENCLWNNTNGISIDNSYDQRSEHNTFYHNNLNDQSPVTSVGEAWENTWDNGYPSGGNYWSNYEHEDQNGDGIGDTPYTAFPNNVDRYPLIVPVGQIPVFWNGVGYDCLLEGNMTACRLELHQNRTLTFRTIGHGWINVTIPKELLSGTFRVFINDTETLSFTSWNKEHTNTSIYLECKVSGSHNVKIEAEMKLLGDINGDGQVNIVDISIVATQYGQRLNP